jgi:predicted O-methyltransferase YrrM
MEAIKKVLRKFIPLSRIRGYLDYNLKWLRAYSSPFVHFYPCGHFYSPVPDIRDVRERRSDLFDRNVSSCPGVHLNEPTQLELLDKFRSFQGEWPFRESAAAGFRYYTANKVFERFDAFVLFSLMRHFQPRRVVEVGSGFSSALMLDTDQHFLGGETRFVFIEPYPERLYHLLSERDRAASTILEKRIQEVGSEPIAELKRNDFLFIDSSHVSKIGSDVNHILFKLLPHLEPGVVVHFHDIYWPFEYPENWVMLGRAWNEAYILRAFLAFNSSFEILFFNSFLQNCHAPILEEHFPLFLGSPASSLWLRKISAESGHLAPGAPMANQATRR